MGSFQELGLDPDLEAALRTDFQITAPTPVQAKAIPCFLKKSTDMVIQSHTGSGKTLAFVLPLLQVLKRDACPRERFRGRGSLALVLLPTKELAQQIYSVLERSTRRSCNWIVPGLLNGTDRRKSEKARIRKGISIVVGTPGRLLDHLQNTACFDVSSLGWIVLDEADRLLDLGFEKKILQILELVRARQKSPIRLVYCSATVDGPVRRIIDKMSPRASVDYLEAGGSFGTPAVDDKSACPAQLVQRVVQVPTKLRLLVLLALLKKYAAGSPFKVITFFSCCDSVDFHHGLLTELAKAECAFVSCPVLRLHGNLEQRDRRLVFESFSAAGSAILLCTDVAARGLDLPAVSLIVQYEPPRDINDYVHRVGRTARIGQKGEAVLFLQDFEMPYVEALKEKGVSISGSLDYEGVLRSWSPRVHFKRSISELHFSISRLISGSPALRALCGTAFGSSVRAYATHQKDARGTFNIKNLHLGHLAKSFGLSDAPSSVQAARPGRKSSCRRGRAAAVEKRQRTPAGEFDSGI